MSRIVLAAAALLLSIPSTVFAGEGKIRRAHHPVRGQYIVVLEEGVAVPDVPTVASEVARDHAGKIRLVFKNAFNGFSVEMTEERAQAISRDPRIAFVEENAEIFLSATQSLPADKSLHNLDRIDQFDPYLNQQYNYWQTGAGVTAYVIDTGVMASHQEFQTTRNGVTVSRVRRGYDAVPGDGYTAANPCNPNPSLSDAYSYNCGHGTGVASVLGGNTTGVAKAVTIVPIRIKRHLFGTVEDVIEGIDSGVLPDHNQYPGPAIANMSFFYWVPGQAPTGNPTITSVQLTSLELAVGRMVSAGITVFTSANNKNVDACRTSPARLARGNSGTVVSVGGSMLSGSQDSRWLDNLSSTDPGSNYGVCVDISAPAQNIRSAHIETGTPYRLIGTSGTSFSSPQVAGIAALYLQNATTASPAAVWNTLNTYSNQGRLAGGSNPLNGSPDKLLYSTWSTQAPWYEGYLDVASCASIHGWAWDRNQPNSPIDVDVYDGTTLLTTLWANSYRPDLVSAGKGNGYHGYGFPAPAALRNGEYHTVRTKYAGTDTNLFSTPKQLICNATTFTTQVPTENLSTGGQVYTVATQFSSSRSGSITHLGFYRASGETGTNTLRLWTDSGVQLASVPTNCTSSGWCWGAISPVAITANTRYRVSVNTNTYQSKTSCGIGSGIVHDPLTAHNGYWIAGTALPTGQGACNSNFFLDVKFDM